MKFTLTITLGNDAMQTPEQLARAISLVAHKILTSKILTSGDEPYYDVYEEAGKVIDENGNSVGEWRIGSN